MTEPTLPREATAEDIPDLLRIRLAVRENMITLERLAELGITESSLATMIGNSHGCWCVGHGQDMAGFAMSDRKNGMIEALFVLPQHEGKGHGKRLLQMAEDDLAQRGTGKAHLLTGPGTRAYGFYLAQGWKPTGREKGNDVELSKILHDG